MIETNLPRHECNAWTEQGKTYFHCARCDYLRVVDMKRGTTRIIRQGRTEDERGRMILHHGSVGPVHPPEEIF